MNTPVALSTVATALLLLCGSPTTSTKIEKYESSKVLRGFHHLVEPQDTDVAHVKSQFLDVTTSTDIHFVDELQSDADAFISDVRLWLAGVTGEPPASEVVVTSAFALETKGDFDVNAPCGDLTASRAFPVIQQFLDDPQHATLSDTAANTIMWHPSKSCVARTNSVEVDGGSHVKFVATCGDNLLLNVSSANGGVTKTVLFKKVETTGAFVGVDFSDGDIRAVGATGRLISKLKLRQIPEKVSQVLKTWSDTVRRCAVRNKLEITGVVGGGWTQKYSKYGGLTGAFETYVLAYAQSFKITYQGIPTEPPVTVPPSTEPPVTQAPKTQPPVTETSTTVPPVTEVPATTTPPMTEAPKTVAQVTEAPATVAPVTVAPTEVPKAVAPVTVGPIGSPMEVSPIEAPTEAPADAPSETSTEIPETTEPDTKTPTTEEPVIEILITGAPVTVEPATEAPDASEPETPTTTEPETETPTDAPETTQQDTEEPTEAPEPVEKKAETDAPTETPESTDAPTEAPPKVAPLVTETPTDTNVPETETSETDAPETTVPVTETPAATALVTEVPTDTTEPETEAPTETSSTTEPETDAPTDVPATAETKIESSSTLDPSPFDSLATVAPTSITPATDDFGNTFEKPERFDPSSVISPTSTIFDVATPVASSGVNLDPTRSSLQELSDGTASMYMQAGEVCAAGGWSDSGCFMNTAMAKAMHGIFGSITLDMSVTNESSLFPSTFTHSLASFAGLGLLAAILIAFAVKRTTTRRNGYAAIPSESEPINSGPI